MQLIKQVDTLPFIKIGHLATADQPLIYLVSD